MSEEDNRSRIRAAFEAWQSGTAAITDVFADGVANDGQPYENSYAWIMRIRDGEVVDGTAFYDSISFNALWERVTPAA
jgi:hypothetical protein